MKYCTEFHALVSTNDWMHLCPSGCGASVTHAGPVSYAVGVIRSPAGLTTLHSYAGRFSSNLWMTVVTLWVLRPAFFVYEKYSGLDGRGEIY